MATYEDWSAQVATAYRGGDATRAQLLTAIKDGARAIMVRDTESDLPLAKSYEDRFRRAKVALAGMRDSETLSATVEAVRELMPVDADTDAHSENLDNAIETVRAEIETFADRYDALMVEAAIELQRHVPFYQVRQLATYLKDGDGVTNSGYISRVALPADARVQQVWYGKYYEALAEGEEYEADDIVVSNGRLYVVLTGGTLAEDELGVGLLTTDFTEEELGDLTFRYYGPVRDWPVRHLDWPRRQAMAAGQISEGPCYTMPDQQDQLWFYPVLDETHRFDLEYVGVAQTFEDDDVVTFDKVAAKAAANYIRGIFAQGEENDARAAAGYLAIYQRSIREAVVDHSDRQAGSPNSVVPYDWSRNARVCGSAPVASSAIYPNGYLTRVNTTGDITLESSASNMIIDLTVGGVARTSIVVLETAGRAAGDRMIVRMTLPAVEAIIFEFRNSTSSGTLLLPEERFTDQQFYTDGFTTSATFEFVFNGTAWVFVGANTPA